MHHGEDTVEPGAVTAEFRSQREDGTAWLVIEHHETTPPTALIEELADAGWAKDPSLSGCSPLDGVVEMTLVNHGSGPFRSWTGDEAVQAMADARSILHDHGFPEDMPVRVLTLADMM